MAEETMNETAAPKSRSWMEPDKDNVLLLYALFLLSFLIGLTAVPGIVMAYVNRGQGSDWINTHYDWCIRTFWLAFGSGLVCAALVPFTVGFFMLIFWAAWLIVRLVVGLQNAAAEKPMEKLETLLW